MFVIFKINELRYWLIITTSICIGTDLSHSRLNCSRDRHRFRGRPANSCSGFYRIPFDTSLLAGCRDCGLLRLHLLVLTSYVALRASYATILQMDKSVFGPEPCTLLLFFNGLMKVHCKQYLLFVFNSVHFSWKTRYTFEHSYLFSTTHSSPSCLSCGHTLWPLPIFRFKILNHNQQNTFICDDRILKQPIVHVFLRLGL